MRHLATVSNIFLRKLAEGFFLTKGLNPGLLHCRKILYWLSHKGRERLPTPVFWPGDSMDCIVHGVTKSLTWVRKFFSPPRLGHPGMFNSWNCTHQASGNYWLIQVSPSSAHCYGGFHSQVFAQISHDSLYWSVSSVLGTAKCPESSLLLWIQKVQSVQLFTCCWNKVATSMLLIWGTGNLKLAFVFNTFRYG